MSNRLFVRLDSRGYPITWLRDVTHTLSKIKDEVKNRRTILITNEIVYQLYHDKIDNFFVKSDILVIPDGEDQKQLLTIEQLANRLSDLGADRKTVLIALGGGVVGDITGFLASIYMRGVSYIQIPTTLLSMVDSSVGGKTGVNSNLGKNMLGTFYQPESVWICPEFLTTLPERELRCGLAEAVKSALIKNKNFYSYIIEKIDLISRKDLSILHHISYQSVSIKRWVVEKDEKENNLRAILNFGHTLAHSLEKYFDYQSIYHGEAVSIGLCFATFYSFRVGLISENTWREIQHLLHKLGLPTSLDALKKKHPLDLNALVDLMKKDKKNQEGSIFFVFLVKIGKCLLPQKVETREVYEVLSAFSKI